jgi:hypothetical protein
MTMACILGFVFLFLICSQHTDMSMNFQVQFAKLNRSYQHFSPNKHSGYGERSINLPAKFRPVEVAFPLGEDLTFPKTSSNANTPEPVGSCSGLRICRRGMIPVFASSHRESQDHEKWDMNHIHDKFCSRHKVTPLNSFILVLSLVQVISLRWCMAAVPGR